MADAQDFVISVTKILRSFPSITLRISTAHNFTRDQRAGIKNWRLFLYGWTSPERKIVISKTSTVIDLFFISCFKLSIKFLYVK